MNRYFNNMIYKLSLLCCAVMMMALTACSDDESGTGTPVITGVRVTDPTKADSLFTDASRGQMIAIIGNNLSDPKEVYINDQSVSFNPNYSTANSLIITIPADLELIGVNPKLTSEIRVVTSHGTANYSFHILAPAATVSYLDVDVYPIKAGDRIIVHGTNFLEVQKVLFTTADTATVSAALSNKQDVASLPGVVEAKYSVSSTFDSLYVDIPANVPEKGTLMVKCYSSTAYMPFFTKLPEPSAVKFGSNMPVVGGEDFIVGSNFIRISNIDINGEYTIPKENLRISISQDTIYFKLPKIPTKAGSVTVNGQGGSCFVPQTFYPYQNLVVDYDNVGSFSWGTSSKMVADGSKAPFTSNGVCYGIVGLASAWNYWWQQIVSNTSYPGTDVIPASTPVSKLELQFECYTVNPVNQVSIQFILANDWSNTLGGYRPVDKNTGSPVVGKWFSCSVPVSKFSVASTYGELVAKDKMLGVMVTNQTGTAENVEMYFDNFRFVVK